MNNCLSAQELFAGKVLWHNASDLPEVVKVISRRIR
jgi:hypothetical protein